jgi:hypothetical protein
MWVFNCIQKTKGFIYECENNYEGIKVVLQHMVHMHHTPNHALTIMCHWLMFENSQTHLKQFNDLNMQFSFNKYTTSKPTKKPTF